MTRDPISTPDVAGGAAATASSKLGTSEAVARAALHLKMHGW